MVDTFFAVVNRDPDTVTNCLMDLGLLCSHNDIQDLKPVKNVVSFLLERFTEKPLNVQEFNEIQSELYTLFKQQPFRLTAEMTFILRALGTLDGIARSLDPQYNLILAAQPFIRTITVGEKRNILSKLGQQATQIIKYKLTRDKTFNSIKRETIELTFASTPQPAELNHENNQLKRIYRAIKSLTYLVFSGFTTLIGILLFLNNYLNWAIFCAGLALFGAIALIRNR
jgi:predicted unusual protein kinase regulating ubiquinone biosynthesis (AarF/ABC1/UbiB family)